MLDVARYYWEAGYEIIVEFEDYEDEMHTWEDILEAFLEVEEDEFLYWRGYEVDELRKCLRLIEESDE